MTNKGKNILIGGGVALVSAAISSVATYFIHTNWCYNTLYEYAANLYEDKMYKEALEKGAIGCILNDTVELDKEVLDKYKDKFIVLVKDSVKWLQELATYKRSLYDILVVEVTGSVGKTSTKDIVASILSKKYNVLSPV